MIINHLNNILQIGTVCDSGISISIWSLGVVPSDIHFSQSLRLSELSQIIALFESSTSLLFKKTLYHLESLLYGDHQKEHESDENNELTQASKAPLNVAVFVVRMCGPMQIGPSRFQYIKSVAAEAISRLP